VLTDDSVLIYRSAGAASERFDVPTADADVSWDSSPEGKA
jgi:hypothetical protein